MKFYLAGPLFSTAEREFNVRLKRKLEGYGLEIWLPQEHEPRDLTAKNIFWTDVEGIDWADGVIAIMDGGADPDSGTAWEVGFAFAKHKKPILLVRTDFRSPGENGLCPYNLMLTESATLHIEVPFKSTDQIAFIIWKTLQKLEEKK